MKTWIALLTLCLLATHGYAEDKGNKKMVKAGGTRERVQAGGQRNLPKNVEQPRAPKKNEGVPRKNTHFSGHEGTVRPYQGGGQQQGPPSGQGPSQPQGGPGWLKKRNEQNAKKGRVGDLGRDAQLAKLTDPTADFKELGGKDPGLGNKFRDRPIGAGGLKGDDSTPNFLATTVGRGYGKNQVSKQDQQSEGAGESDDDDIYDSNRNYMGKRGELRENNDQQLAGGLTPEEQEKYIHDTETGKEGGLTGAEREAYIKDNEDYQRAHVKDAAEAERLKIQQEKELDQQLGNPDNEKAKESPKGDYDHTFATPNPDAVDDSHVPDFVKKFGASRKKDPKTIEEERRRQVGLPGEGQGHRGLRRDDIEVRPEDMLARHTDNRIRPVDGDGTTTNLGAGTNPDVDIDPVTGQPIKGRKSGGGGDPEDED